MKLSVSSGFENLVRIYLSSLSGTPDSLVEIRTALDEGIFLSDNGSLMSVVKVGGRLYEDNNYTTFNNSLKNLGSSLSQFFLNGDRKMHIVHQRHSGGEKSYVDSVLRVSKERAERIGLGGLDLIFGSQSSSLSSKIVMDDVYMALWTSPSILTARDKKNEQEEIKRAEKELPSGEDAQSLTSTYSRLISTHKRFVNNVVDAYSSAGVFIDKLDRDQSLLSMTNVFAPHIKGDFKFIFPDRDHFIKSSENASRKSYDHSQFLADSIASQILPEDNYDLNMDDDVVKVGDRYFTTIEVKNPPRDLVVYNSFSDKIEKGVPFLFSFMIDSNVSFMMFWKKTLAGIPFPKKNKRIKHSIAAVDTLKVAKEPDVDYKVSVSTWDRSYDKLLDNKDYLKTEIGGWGNSQVRNYRGCPLDALTSSVQGVNSKKFGSSVYAPLSGVIPQLPIALRPSLWSSSFLSFLTEGGNLFPFNYNTSLQNYWNIGVCATMGSGKSVLLQGLAMAHLFSATANGSKPMVGYIDQGPSSKYLTNLLAAMSNSESKSDYMHVTLENSKRHGFNIFGTHLGCRSADDIQLKQVVSLLAQIIVPYNNDVHPDLPKFLEKIVKETYTSCSDRELPKKYRKGIDAKLDKLLKALSLDNEGEAYWSIVDKAFLLGREKAALFIQRFAVPTLPDVIAQITKSDTVTNSYSDVEGYFGEKLVKYAQRSLTSVIDEYPVLSGRTELDVESANFIVIDLNNLAKGDSDEDKKRSEMFFVLSKQIVSRNMFYSKDIFSVVEDIYKDYHKRRVSLVTGIPKMLIYDEFHRLKSKIVLSQIITEMREGRKWQLTNVFASQLLRDFKGEVEELLSSTFIMSNDVSSSESEIQDTFKLNSDTMKHLMTKVVGPNKETGTRMVVKLKTKKGNMILRLRYTLSPFMYWSTSSDGMDVRVRDGLMNKTSVFDAVSKLMDKYPYGVRDVCEDLEKNHDSRDVRSDPASYLIEII